MYEVHPGKMICKHQRCVDLNFRATKKNIFFKWTVSIGTIWSGGYPIKCHIICRVTDKSLTGNNVADNSTMSHLDTLRFASATRTQLKKEDLLRLCLVNDGLLPLQKHRQYQIVGGYHCKCIQLPTNKYSICQRFQCLHMATESRQWWVDAQDRSTHETVFVLYCHYTCTCGLDFCRGHLVFVGHRPCLSRRRGRGEEVVREMEKV